MYYILDSNIWIDIGKGRYQCPDLSNRVHIEAVIAPFNITELMMGTIKGGRKHFAEKLKMFRCMTKFDVLELPMVFIYKTLWNVSASTSKLHPVDYKILLAMAAGSNDIDEFLRATERPESRWKKIGDVDSIHKGVLDKEIGALGRIADNGGIKNLHINMARTCQLSGLLPDPDLFLNKFSAAVEFMQSSVLQVRNGAKAIKNNRGLYVDSQLFYYLADPDAVIVSDENFSNEINKSSQKDRIISFAQFLLR